MSIYLFFQISVVLYKEVHICLNYWILGIEFSMNLFTFFLREIAVLSCRSDLIFQSFFDLDQILTYWVASDRYKRQDRDSYIAQTCKAAMMEGIILDFFFFSFTNLMLNIQKNNNEIFEEFEEFDYDFSSRPQHQRKRNNRSKATLNINVLSHIWCYFLTTKKVNLNT